jgi:hypothetical protein
MRATINILAGILVILLLLFCIGWVVDRSDMGLDIHPKFEFSPHFWWKSRRPEPVPTYALPPQTTNAPAPTGDMNQAIVRHMTANTEALTALTSVITKMSDKLDHPMSPPGKPDCNEVTLQPSDRPVLSQTFRFD